MTTGVATGCVVTTYSYYEGDGGVTRAVDGAGSVTLRPERRPGVGDERSGDGQRGDANLLLEAPAAPASTAGQGLLRSPTQSSSGLLPKGNIDWPVTLEQLLNDSSLIPGTKGAVLTKSVHQASGTVEPSFISLRDVGRLSLARSGTEFQVTKEYLLQDGKLVSRGYRIYSGTPGKTQPPAFYRPTKEGLVIERSLGHTHAPSVPWDPVWNQPSGLTGDLGALRDVQAGLNQLQQRGITVQLFTRNEPYGRIIEAVDNPNIIVYGLQSVEGQAVPPSFLQK